MDRSIYQRAERDLYNIENLSGTLLINNAPDLFLRELQGIAPVTRLRIYFTALLFLSSILCWWLLLGLFTKCEFPFKQIFNLLVDSFFGEEKGLNGLCKGVGDLYRERVTLNPKDLSRGDINLQRYNRLNKEKSELYVLRILIKILASGSRNETQEIAKAIEILKKQEAAAFVELDILRKKLDVGLDKVQRTWTKYAEGYSDLEIDYRKINEILDSLIYKFTLVSSPSRDRAEDLLEELRQVIQENSHNIDTSRLETLQNVLQLLRWIASTDYNEVFEYEASKHVRFSLYKLFI